MLLKVSQKQAENVACSGERRRGYRILARKTEGEKSLGRPRRRREDDIKMDLQEVEIWTELIWFWIGEVGGGACESDNDTACSIKC